MLLTEGSLVRTQLGELKTEIDLISVFFNISI